MKPQNFPIKQSLNGSEELYTQTGGISQKFTLDAVKEHFGGTTSSYEIHPTSSELTRIPNNYMGWKEAVGNTGIIYQSVEVEATDRQVSIDSINPDPDNFPGTIYLPLLDKNDPPRYINIGDVVIISGSAIASNNGEWKVWRFDGSSTLDLEQTAERRLTPELSTTATLYWKERKIAELSWVHAQLEDGTLIWEAFNNNTNEDINGYWVAMKPNAVTGEYEYVSHLKMSENFWDYWYDYTVKVDNEPNSIILTVLTDGYGTNNNIGSIKFKLSLINKVLVLEETEYNLNKTWGELYSELTDASFEGSFAQPWYNSDNDFYGMMKGDEMGWYWMYQLGTPYYVGYNMLNGQTQLIDISQSILNIKNIYYNFDPLPAKNLVNALSLITNVFSHSKYGLLISFDSDFVTRDSFTGIWSPNFINVEYVTKLDFYKADTTSGLPDGIFNMQHSFNNDYIIVIERVPSFYPFGGVAFFRKKLDDLNAKAESYSLPCHFNGSDYENGGLYNWERENSIIVSVPTVDFIFPQRNDNLFIWRNDNKLPKLVKMTNIYPNMIEDTKLTGWDTLWDYPNITTTTHKFKNITF